MLNTEERLLVLKHQDRLPKSKLFDLVNAGRKMTGEPPLDKKGSMRMQITPMDSYRGHPLQAVLDHKWRPSKTLPLSVDYIRQYGEDYLLGYLDGYELKEYGAAVSDRSESYARAYVDGFKQKRRESHLKGSDVGGKIRGAWNKLAFGVVNVIS